MKKSMFYALLAAIALWAAFAAVLLGIYQPAWLPSVFAALDRPKSLADFGQAFSAFEGIISSFALMIGLLAILVQARQNTDANIIGALTARQQFLLAEYNRLDGQIADYIERNTGSPGYDKNLVSNMVEKRKSYLAESKQVDERLRGLLARA